MDSLYLGYLGIISNFEIFLTCLLLLLKLLTRDTTYELIFYFQNLTLKLGLFDNLKSDNKWVKYFLF